MEAQGTGREDDDSARRGDNEGPDLDKLFPPANGQQERLALIRSGCRHPTRRHGAGRSESGLLAT